jgi:hypothetical protein
MENIIKKAIDGGFREGNNAYFSVEEIVLMRTFWQSLGKACGWGNAKDIYTGEIKIVNTSVWKNNALKFHEINLTQGWDKAVEYLEDLIK